MLRDTFYVKLKLKGYNFFNRDKIIILEGQEASIEETLDFLEKTEKLDFQIIELIYNFFNKSSKGKIDKKIFSKYIANNLEEILGIMKKVYIKGIFDDKPLEEVKKQEKLEEFNYKTDQEDIIISFARVIAFLTPRMSADPNTLLQKYTWRQIQFWTKHYLYNEREKTKEGQEINKKEDNKRKIDKNKEEIDAELKKINDYLNKKS